MAQGHAPRISSCARGAKAGGNGAGRDFEMSDVTGGSHGWMGIVAASSHAGEVSC